MTPRSLGILNLRRSALVSIGLKGAAYASLIGMHYVAARKLGAADYGRFSYVLAIGRIVAVIAPLGWPILLMRLINKYSSRENWGLLKGAFFAAGATTVVGSIIASFLLAGAAYLPQSHIQPSLRLGLKMAAVLSPLVAFIALRKNALASVGHVTASISLDEIAMPLVVLSSLLIISVSFVNLMTVYITASAVAMAFGWALLWMRLRSRLKNVSRRSEWGYWWRTALGISIGRIGQLVMNSSGPIILASFVPLDEVGIYGVSQRAATLCVFVLGALNIVVAPSLSQAFERGNIVRFRRIVLRTTVMSGTSGLIILLLLGLGSKELFSFLGHSYVGGGAVLWALAIGQFINAVTGPVGFALVVTGREKVFGVTLGLAAAVTVAVSVPLAAGYGALGVAVGTCFVIGALNVTQAILAWKTITDRRNAQGDSSVVK